MTAYAPLVDSHCHLDFDDYASERDAVLARARAAGVAWMVTIGAGRDIRSARNAVALAHQESDVVATVGIHPHDASGATDEVYEELALLATDARVVAIGEIGLDYFYEHSPHDVQQQVFRRFIGLARATGRPVVVHTRNAPADTLAILREEHARDVGGVIHCFTEDSAFASAALDLGFDISFSGILTFPKSSALRAVARTLPLDRVLVETDAPFLAPQGFRGKRNEPCHVSVTAGVLAETMGVDVDTLRAQTTANAVRRFGLKGMV